jgi:ribosomal protein L21
LAEGNYNCTSLGAQEEPLRQVDMEDDMQELDDVVLVDQNDDREAADASVKNIDLLASREEEAEGSSAARLQQERRKKMRKKKRGQRRVQGSRT